MAVKKIYQVSRDCQFDADLTFENGVIGIPECLAQIDGVTYHIAAMSIPVNCGCSMLWLGTRGMELTNGRSCQMHNSVGMERLCWVADGDLMVLCRPVSGMSQEAAVDVSTCSTWMPDRDFLESKIREEINSKTDDILSYGFMWNNIRFPVTLETEITHKIEFDLRQLLPSGHIIKGEGNQYYQMSNPASEYESFFFTGVQFTTEVIATGWTLKDGGTLDGQTVTPLSELTPSGLLYYRDPRSL